MLGLMRAEGAPSRRTAQEPAGGGPECRRAADAQAPQRSHAHRQPGAESHAYGDLRTTLDDPPTTEFRVIDPRCLKALTRSGS
jgi:hypothetical protein